MVTPELLQQNVRGTVLNFFTTVTETAHEALVPRPLTNLSQVAKSRAFFGRLDCKISSSETKLTHCTLKCVVDAARRASVNRLSMCQGQFTMIVLYCLVL